MFHYDRLRNDRALENVKSETTKRRATTKARFIALGDPFLGLRRG